MKEKKYSGELDAAIAEYEALKVQSADVDPVELYDVRHAIRPEYERAVQEKYAEILGKDPTSNAVFNARYNTDKLLHEKEDEQKIQQTIKQRERKTECLCVHKERKAIGWTGKDDDYGQCLSLTEKNILIDRERLTRSNLSYNFACCLVHATQFTSEESIMFHSSA